MSDITRRTLAEAVMNVKITTDQWHWGGRPNAADTGAENQ